MEGMEGPPGNQSPAEKWSGVKFGLCANAILDTWKLHTPMKSVWPTVDDGIWKASGKVSGTTSRDFATQLSNQGSNCASSTGETTLHYKASQRADALAAACQSQWWLRNCHRWWAKANINQVGPTSSAYLLLRFFEMTTCVKDADSVQPLCEPVPGLGILIWVDCAFWVWPPRVCSMPDSGQTRFLHECFQQRFNVIFWNH